MSVRSSPSSWSGAPPRSFSRPRLVLSARTSPDTKTNPRCIAGGCPAPNPFGYPLGAHYHLVVSSGSALAPEDEGRGLLLPRDPCGGDKCPPDAGAVFGEGSDIFALSAGSASGPAQAGPQISSHCRPPSGGGFFRSCSGTPMTSRSASEPRWKFARRRGLRRTTPSRATGSSASRVAGSSGSTRMTTPGLRTSLRPRVRMALSSRSTTTGPARGTVAG